MGDGGLKRWEGVWLGWIKNGGGCGVGGRYVVKVMEKSWKMGKFENEKSHGKWPKNQKVWNKRNLKPGI